MTTEEHARWKGLEVRRPDDIPAPTPLAWQIEKRTEHNDRLMNLALPADLPYDVQRGDVGDALAVSPCASPSAGTSSAAGASASGQAMELGATWRQVADALDVDPDEARELLRSTTSTAATSRTGGPSRSGRTTTGTPPSWRRASWATTRPPRRVPGDRPGLPGRPRTRRTRRHATARTTR
jgi:hypothetical protein